MASHVHCAHRVNVIISSFGFDVAFGVEFVATPERAEVVGLSLTYSGRWRGVRIDRHATDGVSGALVVHPGAVRQSPDAHEHDKCEDV